jgi:hypothetical protein
MAHKRAFKACDCQHHAVWLGKPTVLIKAILLLYLTTNMQGAFLISNHLS